MTDDKVIFIDGEGNRFPGRIEQVNEDSDTVNIRRDDGGLEVTVSEYGTPHAKSGIPIAIGCFVAQSSSVGEPKGEAEGSGPLTSFATVGDLAGRPPSEDGND